MRLSTSALPAEKFLGEWMWARRCDGRGCRFCFAIKSQKHNPRVAAPGWRNRRAMDAELNGNRALVPGVSLGDCVVDCVLQELKVFWRIDTGTGIITSHTL